MCWAIIGKHSSMKNDQYNRMNGTWKVNPYYGLDKIVESFPNQEFRIDGYTSIRLDRDLHGRGFLVYAREDIPYREIRYHTSTRDLEGVTLEINLRKSKWLLFGGYNHTKSNIDSFLNLLAPIIDTHMKSHYEIIL